MEERTGRSRALREELKGERLRRGWSTQKMAEKIRDELGLKSLSGETVRLWENFDRHPSIDRFACWARLLDYRLVVKLVRSERGEAVTLSLHPQVAELASALEMASVQQRHLIRNMLVQMRLLDRPR